MLGASGTSVVMAGAMLEKGRFSTLRNTHTDFGLESLRCERFYLPLGPQWMTCEYVQGHALKIDVPLSVPLRAVPTPVMVDGITEFEYFSSSGGGWKAVTGTSLQLSESLARVALTPAEPVVADDRGKRMILRGLKALNARL
jgi:hypothetical protein